MTFMVTIGGIFSFSMLLFLLVCAVVVPVLLALTVAIMAREGIPTPEHWVERPSLATRIKTLFNFLRMRIAAAFALRRPIL